ncbi:MAG: ABC transporter ATP-binding protein [Roseovarius sp.]|nr:ABC transporter ATP-binding protein [Roseovarius sp.]MCY4292581.1 ABC transporter ATP-binding protein [Roseovarius sp.]MCY4315129.1 ABC transporter ATP-binding protein [Roseovarius sp.]
MTSHPIVELRGVEKRYGNLAAVSNLNLALSAGEFFSLLGPSGCGKTTALRIIAGFQEPTSGQVLIDGNDMADMPANRRPTNMVFQSYAIFPHLDVGKNVGFGLSNSGLSKAERDMRVAEALEMVELGGLEDRKSDALSGGQRQRVALARALVMRPKVLLLDEPLSALDKNLRETMQLELRRLQQSVGITFVMVTHDQYEAMTISDRIGVMFEGRLKQVDAPATLYAQPASREIAAFIGGMNFLAADVLSSGEKGLGVNIRGFGKFHIARNPKVSKHGERIEVGIRPEQIGISTAEEKSDMGIEAVVRDIAFYGESIHYHVIATAADAPLSVAVPNHFHSRDFARGDKVSLDIKSTSIIDLGTME